VGWRDRDYSQDTWMERSSTGFGFRRPPRATAALLGLHVTSVAALYLVGLYRPETALLGRLSLSAQSAHPLAVFTHPLATRDLFSLLLTILFVWALGGAVERQFGARRMLVLYVAGNALAGLSFLAVVRVQPALGGVPLDYPAGALSAWAVASLRGLFHQTVPLFGRPRRIGHIALAAVGSGLGLTLALRGAAGSAWLAAVLVGGLTEPGLRHVRLPARSRAWPRRRRQPHRRPPPEEPELDHVLAKISRYGMAALTPADREVLEAAREAKLRASSRSTV
jgi:membrane associated rhomboid family serine protease